MQARSESAQAPTARSAEWRQVPLRMPRLRLDLRRDNRDTVTSRNPLIVETLPPYQESGEENNNRLRGGRQG